MKKTALSLMLASFLALAMLAVPALANPGITVTPSEHDFGEVEVGSSSSATVEISNNWWGDLTINSVTLVQSDSDFIMVSPPPDGTVVNPGSVIYMDVSFAPQAEGFYYATLEIAWSNGETGVSTVSLQGAGVVTQAPITIKDVLAFYDASIEAGTIQGSGEGRLADLRARFFRGMLVMSDRLIERGNLNLACVLLNRTYLRSDGQDSPTDFIQGDDVPELNCMILQLMADLGCI